MENVLIVGTPISLGVLVSGLAQIIKQSPLLPLVSKGHPWMIRLAVAVIAVVVQVAFNYVNGASVTANLLLDSFVTYVTAAAAYTHVFKPISK